MTFDTKKRILRIVMVLFIVWPIAQFALTQFFDLSPWKLFGWGMYAAPQRNVRARVLEVRGDTVIDFARPVPVEIRDRFQRFQIDRVALGNLLRPDEIADQILDAYPDLEGIMIVVGTKFIDSKTALIVEERENYIYMRENAQPSENPQS